ncbi:MAG: DUF2835 domain-containing protein [Desulfuromonas thiophila]|nr:DUF2835 domain-containing protein [Desulfuromonas thiophila]
MPALTFELHLNTQQFLRYYQGQASQVVVICSNGQRLRLPAANLRYFLRQDGIHGWFRIHFDDNHKLIRLERLSDP